MQTGTEDYIQMTIVLLQIVIGHEYTKFKRNHTPWRIGAEIFRHGFYASKTINKLNAKANYILVTRFTFAIPP